MTDEVIEAIAKALRDQHEVIESLYYDGGSGESYKSQLRDDVIAMAGVVHKFRPDYDLGKFYSEAAYAGTHPVHG